MPPPFQNIIFDNKRFIIMRDDLSHPIFSGNKARKLAYILNSPTKYPHIQKIVSFGGNQSNFMLALSQLAKIMNWEFEYWVKPLPKFLTQNPNGNFKIAIENGMKIIESSQIPVAHAYHKDKNFIINSQSHLSLEDSKSESQMTKIGINPKSVSKVIVSESDTLFFDQGGRSQDAEIGLKECALDIKQYCEANSINDYSIVVASGTGTTALYLEKHIPNKVYTIACVGDDKYLLEQMENLASNLQKPKVLPKKFKSSFGQLDSDNYTIYQRLLTETNIEFDLLYDPIAWRVLLENYDQLPKPIIYIHCGGVSGNITMINRYNRLF